MGPSRGLAEQKVGGIRAPFQRSSPPREAGWLQKKKKKLALQGRQNTYTLRWLAAGTYMRKYERRWRIKSAQPKSPSVHLDSMDDVSLPHHSL